MDRFKAFTSSITKINRAIFQIKSNEMRQYDLNSTSVACIYYLSNDNNLISKDLVNLCCEDKASISRSLKKLEENKYITFLGESDKKKYNTVIRLTNKGEKIASNIIERINAIFDECGKVISDENRVIFYDSLIKIAEKLEDYRLHEEK